jgi:hypothetical protein
METLASIANEFNIELSESDLLDDAFANIDGMALKNHREKRLVRAVATTLIFSYSSL